jgi:hypothetical protein
MVPERNFAVTVLTNSTSGGQLHRAVVNWSLERYLGVAQPELPRMKVPRDELAAYAGTYRIESSGTTFEVAVRNGGLLALLPQNLPNAKTQPPPLKIPLYFFAPDRVTASSGALKGTSGEFIRGPRGEIRWFRLGGRIQRRVKG